MLWGIVGGIVGSVCLLVLVGGFGWRSGLLCPRRRNPWFGRDWQFTVVEGVNFRRYGAACSVPIDKFRFDGGDGEGSLGKLSSLVADLGRDKVGTQARWELLLGSSTGVSTLDK